MHQLTWKHKNTCVLPPEEVGHALPVSIARVVIVAEQNQPMVGHSFRRHFT